LQNGEVHPIHVVVAIEMRRDDFCVSGVSGQAAA